MEFETDRLILRDLQDSDAKQLSYCGNSKEISYFTGEYVKYPFDLKEAEKFIENARKDRQAEEIGGEDKRKAYQLGVVSKKNELMGIVNIYSLDFHNQKGKFGYWIGEDYRNKGYTYEASSKLIDFSFNNLNLNKLTAKAIPENEASNNLLNKLGFERRGLLKEDWIVHGNKKDAYIWELLKKRWAR